MASNFVRLVFMDSARKSEASRDGVSIPAFLSAELPSANASLTVSRIFLL
jgi:hypothetical protein